MKKLIAGCLILTASLPIAFMAGCGSSNSPTSSNSNATSTPTAINTVAATATATIVSAGPAALVLGAASSTGAGGNFAILGVSINGIYNVSGNLGEDQVGGSYPPAYGSPTFTSSSPSNDEYGVSAGGVAVANGANDMNLYGSAAYGAIFAASTGAYNVAIAEMTVANTTTLTSSELGGLSLPPSIYYNASALTLDMTGTSAPLTLENATGNPNNVYIFISASTLQTAFLSSIVLHNVKPANIFWVVESATTLGTVGYNSLTSGATNFVGTIMSYAAITLTSTTLEGHAFCNTAAVNMLSTSAITFP